MQSMEYIGIGEIFFAKYFFDIKVFLFVSDHVYIPDGNGLSATNIVSTFDHV